MFVMMLMLLVTDVICAVLTTLGDTTEILFTACKIPAVIDEFTMLDTLDAAFNPRLPCADITLLVMAFPANTERFAADDMLPAL